MSSGLHCRLFKEEAIDDMRTSGLDLEVSLRFLGFTYTQELFLFNKKKVFFNHESGIEERERDIQDCLVMAGETMGFSQAWLGAYPTRRPSFAR